MANTSEHGTTDLKAHARDYGKFTAMFKWGSIIAFILTAIVVYLIAV